MLNLLIRVKLIRLSKQFLSERSRKLFITEGIQMGNMCVDKITVIPASDWSAV